MRCGGQDVIVNAAEPYIKRMGGTIPCVNRAGGPIGDEDPVLLSGKDHNLKRQATKEEVQAVQRVMVVDPTFGGHVNLTAIAAVAPIPTTNPPPLPEGFITNTNSSVNSTTITANTTTTSKSSTTTGIVFSTPVPSKSSDVLDDSTFVFTTGQDGMQTGLSNLQQQHTSGAMPSITYSWRMAVTMTVMVVAPVFVSLNFV